MSDPKVLNAPDRIWLVVGDIGDDAGFPELAEVTWCDEPQFPADVRYVRGDLYEANAQRMSRDSEALEARVAGLEAARAPRYDHPSLRDIMFDTGYDREEGYWIACTADGRHCETSDDPVDAFRRLLDLLLSAEAQP